MSAEIIDLKAKRNPGNGAREALIEYISSGWSFEVDQHTAEDWADDMLRHLWVSGFKIVPIE